MHLSQPQCCDNIFLKNSKSHDILLTFIFSPCHIKSVPSSSLPFDHIQTLLGPIHAYRRTNLHHACLHCYSTLPSSGLLYHPTFQHHFQVLEHHYRHYLLHLHRRCHSHRQWLRPDPVQLQHVLRRHLDRRWLCGSIGQCGYLNAFA